MKRTGKSSRSLCCFLAALVLWTMSPFSSLTAYAVTQSEIDALQEQLQAMEEQAEAQQAMIQGLTDNKALIVERKIALDASIELTQRQIQLIQGQIELYDQLLREKEEDLALATSEENTQTELLRARMRTMEESGSYSWLSFVFEADSFSGLLGRLADIEDIMHYDQALEAQYTAARENAEEIRREYESILTEQQVLGAELERRTALLNAQIENACGLISSLNDDTENAQAEYAAIEAARTEAEAEIEALLQKLAEEEAARKAAEEEAARQAALAAAAASASDSYTTGGASSESPISYTSSPAVSITGLMWPCPGCSIVTSRFGYRQSPTAGASTYHGGLDIGASQGSAIVAAASGTVILASYNGGYGNCVMIDHGNGTVTLYGHMESIAVSYGQTVSQGQPIGYVGSTGVATGPHCHFEIRINGTQADPAPYFSGLIYYNC